jgi:hypothetical protein
VFKYGGMDPLAVVCCVLIQCSEPRWSIVLQAGGEYGGVAIADVVSGRESPSGRLPFSWHSQAYYDKAAYSSMVMRPNADSPGRTYRFIPADATADVQPLWWVLVWKDRSWNVAVSLLGCSFFGVSRSVCWGVAVSLLGCRGQFVGVALSVCVCALNYTTVRNAQ